MGESVKGYPKKTNGCVRGKDRIDGRILGGRVGGGRKKTKIMGLLSRTFRIKGREEYHGQKTLTVSHQGFRAAHRVGSD